MMSNDDEVSNDDDVSCAFAATFSLLMEATCNHDISSSLFLIFVCGNFLHLFDVLRCTKIAF